MHVATLLVSAALLAVAWWTERSGMLLRATATARAKRLEAMALVDAVELEEQAWADRKERERLARTVARLRGRLRVAEARWMHADPAAARAAGVTPVRVVG